MTDLVSRADGLASNPALWLSGRVTLSKGRLSVQFSYALINNDVNSVSGKNKKAKELGVPVISEADLLSEAGV